MIELVIVRVHFPLAMVERIDRLAAQAGTALGRDVPRAAIVRGIVRLHLGELTPELTRVLAADDVKRGPRPRRPRP